MNNTYYLSGEKQCQKYKEADPTRYRNILGNQKYISAYLAKVTGIQMEV
jgi:hypothetical protein